MVEATPRNMRAYAGAAAYDPATGSTYSGQSGDYFWLAPDEPLVNDWGEPLVLVRPYKEWEHVDVDERTAA